MLHGSKLSIGGQGLLNFCYWCDRFGHTDKDCAFRMWDVEVKIRLLNLMGYGFGQGVMVTGTIRDGLV